MEPIDYRDIAALQREIRQDFTQWSNTFTVTQAIVDEFARMTGDDYWIHVDPVRARAESPYGTTIAHGMLIQALVSRLNVAMPYEVGGFRNMVNYGSDRIRYPRPVPVGSTIHGRSRLKAVRAVDAGTLTTLEMHVHVVGDDRPSMINQLLVLYM